ncbi:hypothetical protein IG631_14787 [Alternaria alternata]|nr:hypothetical protein IG631_14787 [Alternaria alternata]
MILFLISPERRRSGDISELRGVIGDVVSQKMGNRGEFSTSRRYAWGVPPFRLQVVVSRYMESSRRYSCSKRLAATIMVVFKDAASGLILT